MCQVFSKTILYQLSWYGLDKVLKEGSSTVYVILRTSSHLLLDNLTFKQVSLQSMCICASRTGEE